LVPELPETLYNRQGVGGDTRKERATQQVGHPESFAGIESGLSRRTELNIRKLSGPQVTVTELLFEKKELIPELHLILSL
jgi:hypothetical protein